MSFVLDFPTNPGSLSSPNPYFQDNGLVRGDQQRSWSQQAWANFLQIAAEINTILDRLADLPDIGSVGLFPFVSAPTNVLYLVGTTGLLRASYTDLWNAVTVTFPEWTGSDSRYASSSVSSNTIGTGSFSFACQTGLSFIVGQYARASVSADKTKFIEGIVTAYNPGTGLLTFTETSNAGSGSYSAWTIQCADKTLFGMGNGSTTFSLPDWRGLVPRGAGASSCYKAANATAYNGGSVLSQLDDMLQGFTTRLGGDYANQAAGSPPLVLTNDGIGNLAKPPVTDGTNGAPRLGYETRGASVAVNFGVYYA